MSKEITCLEIEKDCHKDYLSISPDIVQTTNFQFKNFDHYVQVNSQGEFAYTYTRGDNPTLHILEEKIAKLEEGEKAQAFASEMSAISSTILSLVNQGDHIMIINTVYGSCVKFIQSLTKFGITNTKIDVSHTDEIWEYIQDNTKLIYFESPSSQKFELLDLEKISKVAKKKGIYTIIDNTWSTPLLQNPLKYGIDIVIHSCSKYIGGHSDVVGGIVISNKDIMKKIKDYGQVLLGGTMSPMNAWLTIRGLRTLPTRIHAQEESVKKVILFMENDNRIEKIYHPFSANIEQQKLAKQYLKGYSSLFGFVLKNANANMIKTFIDSLNHFTLAYSWGGFESLIMPVFKGNNEKELLERGLSIGHIRMYIGLEDVDLLIGDIKNALDKTYK